MSGCTSFHFHVSLAHVEKHEEPAPVGSPDSHTVSEGQKATGMPKATRKGKEKASEKEKSAKEKQTPRFEPQVGADTIPSLFNRAGWVALAKWTVRGS